MRRFLFIWAAGMFVGAALVVSRAQADGDPASDVLYVQTVFVPFGAKLAPELQKALARATAAAARAGYPIRVALIGHRYDLGAVPSLWLKPQTYADFLGRELSFVYHGRVLVVMPNGLGIFWRKPLTASERRIAGEAKVRSIGIDDLAGAALETIGKLAASTGHRISVPQLTTVSTEPRHRSSSSGDRLEILAAAGGAALLAAALFYRRSRGDRRSRPKLDKGGRS